MGTILEGLQKAASARAKETKTIGVTFVVFTAERRKTLPLNIEVFRYQGSTYARYQPLGLSAGSQEEEQERAEVKAIMRLYDNILMQLKAWKAEGEAELERLLSRPGIDVKTKRAFLEFCEDLKIEETGDPEKIPVFSEQLTSEERNCYSYRLIPKKPVADLAEIQKAKQEQLSLGPLASAVKLSAIITDQETNSCRVLSPLSS